MPVTKTRAAGGNVRLSELGRESLDHLVRETGKKQIDILEEALDRYREQLFWDKVDAGYATHGRELQAEYADLEGASADGLDSEEG